VCVREKPYQARRHDDDDDDDDDQRFGNRDGHIQPTRHCSGDQRCWLSTRVGGPRGQWRRRLNLRGWLKEVGRQGRRHSIVVNHSAEEHASCCIIVFRAPASLEEEAWVCGCVGATCAVQLYVFESALARSLAVSKHVPNKSVGFLSTLVTGK